ncbi:hypothetical protein GL263_15720 [Streptomyces durbertensis]|uniref:Uncharacterized protein n=1 Tax=Streptomyces durbertensis TaxID=2448886 RepID=A0ABR6EI61_9ACTN|nr:hypothetical protein [Streptomyces durbertensis]MBB1245005.1 hypothetical protein [Streptomyces durbertensis]
MTRKNRREQHRTRIEAELASARTPDDVFATFDSETALERIASRVVWTSARTMETRARSVRQAAGSGSRQQARSPLMNRTLHHEAACLLEELSCTVIRDEAALAAMRLLVDDRQRIDPDGALAFACLLYLVGGNEAARFWWQFAAGADSLTAAHCLYLHHLQHGEFRDAEHWAEFAWAARSGLKVSLLPATDTPPPPPGASTRPCTTRLSAALTNAMCRLEISDDDDFGTIPRPDPGIVGLVAELERAGT